MTRAIRFLGAAFCLTFVLFGSPQAVWACPSCAGAVPWDDGVEAQAEGLAYNRSIGLMLAVPTILVCALTLASRQNQRPRPSDSWD